MILQTDSRLKRDIQRYGCYFLSILYLVNKYTGYELDCNKINTLYDNLLELGYIKDNCYIVNPTAIFKHLGLNATYTDRHEPPDYYTGANELEILCFQRSGYRHFMVGINGEIAYDPMGNSKGGYLLSKRIFKL